ncbi:uncharacterized protein LOC111076243 [Drosophila obscura]|uniref:uncharacterized protein LOC111076243 n=1 Tax=Drosophila obscura TaxID=7282 RepID=UPI001BB1322A|nr:uncharacterized protein LOC111076243 [Drosophila obscura]
MSLFQSQEFLCHLLLLGVFAAVYCFLLMGIQIHNYNWQHLTHAWTDLKANKNTDPMFSYQDTFNCCGFMDPNEYVHINLTLPESCLIDHSNNVKESCYKVFRDADFTYYAIIVAILCAYIVSKLLLDYVEWRMILLSTLSKDSK